MWPVSQIVKNCKNQAQKFGKLNKWRCRPPEFFCFIFICFEKLVDCLNILFGIWRGQKHIRINSCLNIYFQSIGLKFAKILNTRDLPGIALVLHNHFVLFHIKCNASKKKITQLFDFFLKLNLCFDALYVLSFYSKGKTPIKKISA